MAQTYDPTLKLLVETSPEDWPEILELNAEYLGLADADIATVTGASDKVLRIKESDGESILHLEFQSSRDREKPRRMNIYNAVLEDRHEVPVRSVLIVLRPEALGPEFTGSYEMRLPGKRDAYRTFHYDVVRIWEIPAESFLHRGVGSLPLAPIGKLDRIDLPFVLNEINVRLSRKSVSSSLADELWAATSILMGLKYEKQFVRSLLAEVRRMKESVTYQIILEEGALAEARKMLLEIGSDILGAPNSRVKNIVAKKEDVQELEQLVRRIHKTASWEELLDIPEKPARKKK